MRTVAFAIVIGAFAAFGVTSVGAQSADLDCYQFSSWDAANATYQNELAASGWDWMRLDEDGDGLPCECLYYGYHCWTPGE